MGQLLTITRCWGWSLLVLYKVNLFNPYQLYPLSLVTLSNILSISKFPKFDDLHNFIWTVQVIKYDYDNLECLFINTMPVMIVNFIGSQIFGNVKRSLFFLFDLFHFPIVLYVLRRFTASVLSLEVSSKFSLNQSGVLFANIFWLWIWMKYYSV